MSYLLDTDVVSEIRKGERADPVVGDWLSSVRARELYISVLVVGEIRQGIERHRRPGEAEILDTWLERLRRDYADRVVPVTAEIAEEWGRMNVPGPLPAVDADGSYREGRGHDLRYSQHGRCRANRRTSLEPVPVQVVYEETYYSPTRCAHRRPGRVARSRSSAVRSWAPAPVARCEAGTTVRRV